MLTSRGNIVTICAQYVRCGTDVSSFVADLGVWFTCFFEGIMKSLLITWWILSLSLSLGRQNVPWTAAHFVALGRQCMQGATKCAVKAARFVADDKLCRGDKMCRNMPSITTTQGHMIFCDSPMSNHTETRAWILTLSVISVISVVVQDVWVLPKDLKRKHEPWP